MKSPLSRFGLPPKGEHRQRHTASAAVVRATAPAAISYCGASAMNL